MGYTTDFNGSLSISRPLTKKQTEYINRLSSTRRMKRDVNKLMEIYKGKYGYPFAKEKTPESIYGLDGEFFAHDDGNAGQKEDASIINYNQPPGQVVVTMENLNKGIKENETRSKKLLCQPGLWCQWVISDDGKALEWDGGEKFYNYIEWLKYLINRFFEPWGKKLNGEIYWEGEDSDDRGIIVVKDNVVKIKIAEITFKEVEDEE